MKKIMKKMTLAPAELTIIALGAADVLCTSTEMTNYGYNRDDYFDDEDEVW